MKNTSDYSSDSSGVLDNAKQAAISGATAVQERVKDAMLISLAKAQEGINAGLDTTQDTLKSMQKGSRKYSKKLKKMQKTAGKNVENLQKGAKKNLQALQQSAESNLPRMQKEASKNLKVLQESAASNMQALQKGAKKNLKALKKSAGENMQSAQKNIQQANKSLQAQRAKAARRRWRKKWVFRIALMTGITLGMLFAPQPGSELRRQLASFWRRVSGRVATLPERQTVTQRPDMAASNRL